jgi:hypothetical protein
MRAFIAMSTYVCINWDFLTSLPDFVELVTAMFELKNEIVYTRVRPYAESFSITEEEHNALHSTRLNSNISYPHSFVMVPVYENPTDDQSKIVASVGTGFAWDYALRHLLPDNVQGIIVEIQNSCSQTSLYELDGHDAFYLGDNSTKESKYDDMEVIRNLYFSNHPNFTKTTGHCRYTIVCKYDSSLLLQSFQ